MAPSEHCHAVIQPNEVHRGDHSVCIAVTTARSKGLKEQVVIIKHALKNALIPIITVVGLQFGLLLGGAVVTETVFAWPGLGRLAVESIRMGDYPVVQAIVIVFAICVILGNLAADILAALIDPRIRLD